MVCASNQYSFSIQGVCTEAGMYALRERRVHVTQEDFEMAVAKVMQKDSEKNMSIKKLWKWSLSYNSTLVHTALRQLLQGLVIFTLFCNNLIIASKQEDPSQDPTIKQAIIGYPCPV